MDATRFDWLVRSLSTAGSRRGLLGFFSALPLLGGLAALLVDDESAAKGRRKRHKKPHRHRKHSGNRAGKRKKKHEHRKKRCAAQSIAVTCAGTCGLITNNCQQRVDCGSCACDPLCPVCQTCQEGPNSPGACVVDPEKIGDACGAPGQVCQSDGTCGCDARSCSNPSPVCVAGKCTACSAGAPCLAGCCANDGSCQPGATSALCGADGESCQICVNPAPICTNLACAACTSNGECQAAGVGDLCCSGSCFAGICCADAECAPSGNGCVSNQCQCGSDSACSGATPDCCGTPGGCTDTQTDENNCGACGATCSGATPRCWDGACVCGDVCATGCQFTSIQDAINGLPAGSTIRICAGVYSPITISKNLTLIGAGDADDENSNTILDAAGSGRVMDIDANITATLQGLRITGGSASGYGGGIFSLATSLTMIGCTVTGNSVEFDVVQNVHGGGIANIGDLTMVDCRVTANTAQQDGFGGGIYNEGTLGMTNCTIADNHGFLCGGLLNVGDATLNACTVEVNGGGFAAGIRNTAGATLVCDGGTISGNEASHFAGGIWNDDASAVVTLRNGASVTANTAGEEGGGILNDGTVSCESGATASGNTVNGSPSNCIDEGAGSGCSTCLS